MKFIFQSMLSLDRSKVTDIKSKVKVTFM